MNLDSVDALMIFWAVFWVLFATMFLLMWKYQGVRPSAGGRPRTYAIVTVVSVVPFAAVAAVSAFADLTETAVGNMLSVSVICCVMLWLIMYCLLVVRPESKA